MPPNAGGFFKLIMNLAAFNILPTQTFYDTYLPPPPTDGPLNDNFNSLGLGSMYFLKNLGSMIIGLVSLPVLFTIVIVLKYLKNCNKKMHRIYEKLNGVIFWGQPITLLNETFWMVCLCTFVNSKIVSNKYLIIFRFPSITWMMQSTQVWQFCF